MTTREEYSRRKKVRRGVTSLKMALEPDSFDKLKPSSELKKYLVKVGAKVRPEKKIVWTNQKVQTAGRQKAHNIIPNKPGLVTEAAKNAKSALKAFELFFDPRLMNLMVTQTNRSIQETRASMPAKTLNSDKNPHFGDTDELELKTLIDLYYYKAMFNQSLESVNHLFEIQQDLCHPIYSATMSRNRFKFLSAHLSFDDKNTRAERWQHDR